MYRHLESFTEVLDPIGCSAPLLSPPILSILTLNPLIPNCQILGFQNHWHVSFLSKGTPFHLMPGFLLSIPHPHNWRCYKGSSKQSRRCTYKDPNSAWLQSLQNSGSGAFKQLDPLTMAGRKEWMSGNAWAEFGSLCLRNGKEEKEKEETEKERRERMVLIQGELYDYREVL